MSGTVTRPDNLSMKRIWTIPNILSMIRILLIPVFAYAYLKGFQVAAGITLIVSGLTDTVDGYVARHFNQITNLGKVLDPIADKLTQGVATICACVRYQFMFPILILLIVKEVGMAIAGIIFLKIKRRPFCAFWWGKVSTTIFYVFICFLFIFGSYCPVSLLEGLSFIPFAALVFSMVRYAWLYVKIFRGQEGV